MNSKDNKYLVPDAKPLNKSTFQSSSSNKYPLSSVSKTVNSSNSTKDAKQAFFASSISTSSTSKYKESSQKSYTTTSKVTTSSWTSSANAAAESKTFLKSTPPVSKYPPIENKYNSYSSINRDAPQIPTNSIFYTFDKSIQRPFGSETQSSKYISPYRGQTAQPNPYTIRSSSETAKWSDPKTNPALYKKPTATVNSIQKPLGALLLTTAAGAAIHKSEKDSQIKTTNGLNSTPSQPSITTASTRRFLLEFFRVLSDCSIIFLLLARTYPYSAKRRKDTWSFTIRKSLKTKR